MSDENIQGLERYCANCGKPVGQDSVKCENCCAELSSNGGSIFPQTHESAKQSSRPPERIKDSLREISSLYQASYRLVHAETDLEVYDIVLSTIHQTTYQSAVFRVDMKGLHLVSERQTNHTSWGGHPKGLVYPDLINTEPGVMENMIGGSNNFRMINLDGSIDFGSELPEVKTTTPIKSGCKSLVLIPGRNNGKIELLILLGLQDDQQFTSERLDLYYSLASMAVSILSKFNTQQRLEKRVAALQSLNTVSQAVSVETDLNILYQLIHREVSSIVGKVNFAIATYDAQQDSITVPYMYDGQSTRSVEAFPMGEGLTSILIRTKRSLLLVDDTERKTKELGAKLVGKPAKSWLGVPLLVGGEVIGAILLQDLEQEGRFDKDDQLLMETLATQVAVAIRNARVLETLHKQASRQQQLYEITSKIRSSPNISGILETTASELTKVLGARRTSIELGLSPTKQNGLVSTDSTGA